MGRKKKDFGKNAANEVSGKMELGHLYGAEEIEPPPDCSKWVRKNITINDVSYEVVRRPRLFRYAAKRAAADPSYEDFGELPDGGDPEDVEYQKRIFESKLWILEFDVDIQGDRKTLRISFTWPSLIPTFAQINQSSDVFPQGLRTFLGHTLYPISVRLNKLDPYDCTLTTFGDWAPYLKRVQYFCYKNTPFGMMPEDREEAEQNAPARAADVTAGRDTKIKKTTRINISYSPIKRRLLYAAWQKFKETGGRRYKVFFEENSDLCNTMYICNVTQVKKAIDSERKERKKRQKA